MDKVTGWHSMCDACVWTFLVMAGRCSGVLSCMQMVNCTQCLCLLVLLFVFWLQQEQEDAQEFLQFVVMAAHEEVLKLRSNLPAAGQPNTAAADAANSSSRQQQAADNASKQADSSHNKQTQEDPEEWSVVGKRNKAAITRTSGKQEDVAETSVLSAMFRGILKSSVKAKGVQAAKPSVTIQPFTTLQLHLVENVRSIEDALEAMTHTELIHDYMVKGFEQGVDAEKSVKLSKLPQVRVGHEGCWRSQ
eukprot:GHRR01030532.1.p1 GENE.GHRR01030532.1~~GHRR01030532.1.p1  ORF type:complete len:248 (+),score=95.47 GHRR01030532.1:289-1032(+)